VRHLNFDPVEHCDLKQQVMGKVKLLPAIEVSRYRLRVGAWLQYQDELNAKRLVRSVKARKKE
jgi:hypothetical protein